MFIVIEGTDASGKSTLIAEIERQLSERFPGSHVHKFHKGKPEELTRRWVLKDYVTSVESTNWHRSIGLSDRWHWGEMTYAIKYRPDTDSDGYGLLGKAGWRWVELFLMSRGVAQFWLYQPIDVLTERLRKRGDEFVKEEDLEDLVKLYSRAAGHSCLTNVVQPTQQALSLVEQQATEVINAAVEVEKNASHLEFFPYYIGNPRPQILLVGDTRNITKKYGEETLLPFMPVDGNSAEYLLSALPDGRWRDVGIININDPNVKQNFNALWDILGFPKIVVLGRLAEKTLASIPVDEHYYNVLPHPQYVRRFFNREKTEYGEAIFRVALAQEKDKDEPWIMR